MLVPKRQWEGRDRSASKLFLTAPWKWLRIMHYTVYALIYGSEFPKKVCSCARSLRLNRLLCVLVPTTLRYDHRVLDYARMELLWNNRVSCIYLSNLIRCGINSCCNIYGVVLYGGCVIWTVPCFLLTCDLWMWMFT